MFWDIWAHKKKNKFQTVTEKTHTEILWRWNAPEKLSVKSQPPITEEVKVYTVEGSLIGVNLCDESRIKLFESGEKLATSRYTVHWSVTL